MSVVAAQGHRDLAIFRAWVDGAHQDELAVQYGVQQPAISKAVGRVLEQFPEPDKAQEVRRSLRLVDELLAVYVPKARAGTAWANREVRGLLALKGRYLGVDRREVEHTGTVEVAHHWEPGPTVEQVLEKFREQGLLRPQVELTRTDQ